LNLPIPQEAIIKGDQKCLSIAAASIVAKVTRDRIMTACHREYPEYNFARHKGYATKEHLQAIEKHGHCRLHRLSFRQGTQPVLL
jgi:ribonuclease HII